jgi:hypothetical protein
VAILGIDLSKDCVNWCVLDGTRGAPQYICHGVELYNVENYTTDLIVKSEAIFLELLEKHNPSSVAYRLSVETPKIDQCNYLHFPYAILLQICHSSRIPCVQTYLMGFTAKQLGFDKTLNRHQALDAIVGSHSPHWSKVRNAALASWSQLPV